MQVSVTSNVLLATAYGVGYALCDRNSAVQWAWRAAITLMSAMLYAMSDASDNGALLVLCVAILSDLCDNHRDALGLALCTIGPAVVGLMIGNPMADVDQGGWIPTLAAASMALLVPHRPNGLPSLDAIAMVLAAVVPCVPEPHEACARVFGLCLVLYFNSNAPRCMPVHKTVHLMVAPWPAAGLVVMTQIGLVTEAFPTRSSTGSGTINATPVMV